MYSLNLYALKGKKQVERDDYAVSGTGALAIICSISSTISLILVNPS